MLRSGDKNDSGSSSEPSGSDVAKFRLWVKSKGLTLTRPGTEKDPPSVSGVDDDCQEEDTPMLFVPTGTDKVSRIFAVKLKLNYVSLLRLQ